MCYNQGHRETKIIPADKGRIHKNTVKRKSYQQGHTESGKLKTKREKFIVRFLKRRLKFKFRIQEKSQN